MWYGESAGELIVPLDRNGHAQHARPIPPKTRAIDLRVGDWLRHGRNVYRISDLIAASVAATGSRLAVAARCFVPDHLTARQAIRTF